QGPLSGGGPSARAMPTAPVERKVERESASTILEIDVVMFPPSPKGVRRTADRSSPAVGNDAIPASPGRIHGNMGRVLRGTRAGHPAVPVPLSRVSARTKARVALAERPSPPGFLARWRLSELVCQA